MSAAAAAAGRCVAPQSRKHPAGARNSAVVPAEFHSGSGPRIRPGAGNCPGVPAAQAAVAAAGPSAADGPGPKPQTCPAAGSCGFRRCRPWPGPWPVPSATAHPAWPAGSVPGLAVVQAVSASSTFREQEAAQAAAAAERTRRLAQLLTGPRSAVRAFCCGVLQ